MIHCRDVVERLWTYLDGELDEADQQSVEEHLRLCVRCCGEAAFAEELRGILARRARPPMPAHVQRQLEAFIEQLDPSGPES